MDDESMDSVYGFLREKRNVSETAIKRMIDDGVSKYSIQFIWNTDQLSCNLIYV